MERGLYVDGKKTGTWEYWYANGTPMLVENCQDSICLVVDAWDRDSTRMVELGNGTLRNYYGSGSLHEEADYAHGVRSGAHRELWPAGNPKAEGAYLGGVKDGPWTYGPAPACWRRRSTTRRVGSTAVHPLRRPTGTPTSPAITRRA